MVPLRHAPADLPAGQPAQAHVVLRAGEPSPVPTARPAMPNGFVDRVGWDELWPATGADAAFVDRWKGAVVRVGFAPQPLVAIGEEGVRTLAAVEARLPSAHELALAGTMDVDGDGQTDLLAWTTWYEDPEDEITGSGELAIAWGAGGVTRIPLDADLDLRVPEVAWVAPTLVGGRGGFVTWYACCYDKQLRLLELDTRGRTSVIDRIEVVGSWSACLLPATPGGPARLLAVRP